MKNKKSLFFGSLLAALLILISGLGKPHLSPFTSHINFSDVSSFSASDKGYVAADSRYKRLLFAGTDKTVTAIVELDTNESPFDRVTDIQIFGDLVYVAGRDLYSEGSFISAEKIAVYELNGKYLETVYEETYDSDSYVKAPMIKDLCVQEDRLLIVSVEDSILSLLSFSCTDKTVVTLNSWGLDETVFTAFYNPSADYILCASRTPHYYIVRNDGSVPQKLSISEFLDLPVYVDGIELTRDIKTDFFANYKVASFTSAQEGVSYLSAIAHDGGSALIHKVSAGEQTVLTQFTAGVLLRVEGLFHYLALLWIILLLICALIYMYVNKKPEPKFRTVVLICLLVAVTAVFYTFYACLEVKKNYSDSTLKQGRIISEALDRQLVKYEDAIRTQGVLNFCHSEEYCSELDILQKLLENICDVSGTDVSMFSQVYLCETDGSVHSLLDSRRGLLSGVRVGSISELEAALGASPDTTVYISGAKNDCYLSYSYLYDSEGDVLAVVISGFYADSLTEKQKNLAVSMAIDLSAILIVLYMLSSVFTTFYHDFKRRNSRAADDFENRSADIAGIYVFTNSIANSMDGVILVFVAQSLCSGMDPITAAAMAAIPLTAGSIGNWLGTFFANPISNKIGERRLSWISALLGIGSMLLCVFSIQISSIYLFSVAKFLSNVIYRGFIYVIGETIPFNSSNEETRKAANASTKEASYAAGILSTLLGGYISQYFSYSMIYLIAAAATVPLLVITPMVFPSESKKTAPDSESAVLDAVNAWKFWLSRDMIVYILLYMFPRTLMSGYNSYFLPLYTSGAGISKLMLSNFSVYSKTLTYTLNDTLRSFTNAHSASRVMILSQLAIACLLILFLISPNVYWALIAMFLMSIFSQMTVNVATLFIGDTAEEKGYNAKTEVSNYYTVYSGVGCAKSSVLSLFLSLGLNIACVALGLVAGGMISLYTLYLKMTQGTQKDKVSDKAVS